MFASRPLCVLQSNFLPAQLVGGSGGIKMIDKKILIDNRLFSYEPFFDNEWAKEIVEFSQSVPRLYELVLNLLLNFRAAIYTVSFPYLLPEGLTAFHDAMANSPNVPGSTSKLVNSILFRLTNGITEIFHDDHLVKLIKNRANEIHQELIAVQAENPIKLSAQSIWDDYLSVPSFAMMVWGSQRTSFISLHCSYEDFIVRILRILRAEEKYRKPNESNFQKHLSEMFGNEMLEEVWTKKEIKISRVARNCLSHGSGKENFELKSLKHSIRVKEGVLQIFPEDIKRQFATFKIAIKKLILFCNKNDKFK
jgi:hypothetical protein